MKAQHILLLLVVVAALFWAIRSEQLRRAALGRFWARSCTGLAWRRTFPQASSADIRRFLLVVCDSFGFESSRGLKLAPADSLLSLYRTAYPDPSAPDALEIEVLDAGLRKTYGSGAFDSIGPNVTFGELFARSCGWLPNPSLERP